MAIPGQRQLKNHLGCRNGGALPLPPTRVYPSWASQIVEVGYIRLRWERAGVRGYDLSMGRNPSPGATRRPLPKGEVKANAFRRFKLPALPWPFRGSPGTQHTRGWRGPNTPCDRA